MEAATIAKDMATHPLDLATTSASSSMQPSTQPPYTVVYRCGSISVYSRMYVPAQKSGHVCHFQSLGEGRNPWFLDILPSVGAPIESNFTTAYFT